MPAFPAATRRHWPIRSKGTRSPHTAEPYGRQSPRKQLFEGRRWPGFCVKKGDNLFPEGALMPNTFVFYFGGGQADGSRSDKALLGGKGANLAEMTRIG